MIRQYALLSCAMSALILSGCARSETPSASADKILSEADTLPTRMPRFGDPAPPFDASGWVQGAPVDFTEHGKVFVVFAEPISFTGTKESARHMERLWKKFGPRGLAVAGLISAFGDESPAQSKATIRNAGVTFPVAEDKGLKIHGRWNTVWEDARISAYPRAVVVRDGTIIWVGHAQALSEPLITSILDGRYGPADAARERDAEFGRLALLQKLKLRTDALAKAGEYEEAFATVEALMEKVSPERQFLREAGFALVRSTPGYSLFEAQATVRLNAEIEDLVADEKWDAAWAKTNEMERLLLPGSPLVPLTRILIVSAAKDRAKVSTQIARFADQYGGNPQSLFFAVRLLMDDRYRGSATISAEDISLCRRWIEKARANDADSETADFWSAITDLAEKKDANAVAGLTRLAEGAHDESVRERAAHMLVQIRSRESAKAPLTN